MLLPAHGVGTRADLPVPLGPAAAAAAATLVISFVVLALCRRTPRETGAGTAFPAAVTAFVDHPVTRTVARGIALTAMLLVIASGLAGPAEVSDNIAPWAFFITFWAGLVPASLLFGPVLRYANPLRLVHTVLATVLRIDPDRGLLRLPAALGFHPAAVVLLVFAWFELVAPHHSDPRPVAWFVLAYVVAQIAAALLFGRRWFARGDGFEVYSTLLGALAPVGRLPGGRFGLRNPMDGLERIAPAPGLAAVLIVLVGSTGFDGLTRSLWWSGTVSGSVTAGTLGLLGSILLVAVVYLLGCTLATPVDGRSGDVGGPAAFATTLVPIAAGYAIAHYFSLFVFDGQQTAILGRELVAGPTATGVDYTVVGPVTIMAVQLAAIIAGHLAASLAGHDRALRLYPPENAVRTQFPMLAAMVALTVGAVGLLFSA